MEPQPSLSLIFLRPWGIGTMNTSGSDGIIFSRTAPETSKPNAHWSGDGMRGKKKTQFRRRGASTTSMALVEQMPHPAAAPKCEGPTTNKMDVPKCECQLTLHRQVSFGVRLTNRCAHQDSSSKNYTDRKIAFRRRGASIHVNGAAGKMSNPVQSAP